MNKNLNNAIGMIAKLAISEKQSAICSKVCGRENYVITLFDGKVIFYGTKGAWAKYSWTCYLKDAFRYNHIKFTYKKDWLNALNAFGINI